jgi:hypothetical protein
MRESNARLHIAAADVRIRVGTVALSGAKRLRVSLQ